ncbi:MAG: hypothetical protein M1821_002414, partial [Bathelium mastoideum]
FLAIDNVAFVMFQPALIFPSGRSFIQKAKAHRRQIYSWTVSDDKNIDWCIRQEVDGIVTDEVERALQMCDKHDGSAKYSWSMKTLLGYLYFNFYLYLFGLILSRRYSSCIDTTSEAKKRI